jgi:hypothetical protein
MTKARDLCGAHVLVAPTIRHFNFASRIRPRFATAAQWDLIMSKGNNKRGNKEAKKPKQPKKEQAVTATAGFEKGFNPAGGLGAKKK